MKRFPEKNLFMAALVSLILLLAVTLLYPDTLISRAIVFAGVRISPLGVGFALCAPAVIAYFWKQRASLDFQLLDLFIVGSLSYITVRGAVAASTANGIFLVLAYAAYALVNYYGMAVLGQGRAVVRAVFISLAVIGLIISIYAIIEFIAGRNLLFEGLIGDKVTFRVNSLHRTASTLGGPGILGTAIVQIAPFMVFFFMRAAGAGRKFMWGAVTVVALAALWVSYSKISIATAGLLTVGLFFWTFRRRAMPQLRNLSILLAVAIVVITAMVAVYSDNASYNLVSTERTDESVNLRWYLWEQAPGILADHPLLGTGLWQGDPGVGQGDPGVGQPRYTVDNQYLITLIEEGLVGTVILAGTFFLLGKQTWRSLGSGDEMHAWIIPIAVSMGAVLLIGVTSNPLFVWPNMVLFWLEAGLIRAIVERRAASGPQAVPEGNRG
ncbi:MAG: O-antigen ligase family protein [Thermoleophilia bacterium]